MDAVKAFRAQDWTWIAEHLPTVMHKRGRFQETPLIMAVRYHAPTWLLEQIISLSDIDAVDALGTTALFMAVLIVHAPAVELLLQWGADPSQDMPLYRAIQEAKTVQHVAGRAHELPDVIRIIRLLLDAGADVNQRNRIDNTALFKAFLERVHPEIIKMLMMAGGKVDRRAFGGQRDTPVEQRVNAFLEN